jgi:hypothetical protein
MAVTPNYSWPIPVATDYVKDGWDAIADLGNAIDTTVYGLGSSGLTLVGTASPSAASSVTISNCFTTTYDRYLILWSLITASGATAVNAQMTLSGTANTESLYFTGTNYITNSGGPTRTYTGSTTAMNFGNAADLSSSASITLNNPALAKPTNGNVSYTYWGSGANEIGQGGFAHNKSVAYDGIKLTPASSTLTGEIRIYGYKNS